MTVPYLAAISVVVAAVVVIAVSKLTLRLPTSVSIYEEMRELFSDSYEEAKEPATKGPSSFLDRWGLVIGLCVMLSAGLIALSLIGLKFPYLGPVIGQLILSAVLGGVLATRLPTLKMRWIAAVAVLGVTYLWMFFPGWVAINVTTVVMLAAITVAYQLFTSFWRATIVMGVFSLLLVALSLLREDLMKQLLDRIHGEGRLMVLVFPISFEWSAPTMIIVGQTELVFMCLISAMTGRIAQRTGKQSIYWAAIAGGTIGLTVSTAVDLLLAVPQVASIYIMLCSGSAVWLTARLQNLQTVLYQRAIQN